MEVWLCETRQGECQSRVGVTAWEGRERLDAQESHLSPARVQVGPVLHQRICITNKCTAPSILHLVPRPSSSGCGCLVPTLGELSNIRVPTIHLNHMLLGEASTGAMIAVSIAPVWYNQLWYPSLLRALMNYPILLPPVRDILIGPEVQRHSMVLQGHLPLVAWFISRDPTTPRDFRRELLSLSENLGGPHLSQPTLPPGISGIAGA